MINTPSGVDAPDFGGMSEHSVETVFFDDAAIGWLFSFGPPLRYVFETLSAELWDLERIAWKSESEALKHIRSSAQDSVAILTGLVAPLHSIDSRFDVMTVLATESVVFDGRELGRIHWDSLSRKCVFETPLHELKELESIAWPCPASARLHVEAFDQAVREGMAAGRGIQ